MDFLKIAAILVLITLIPALELRASIPYGILGNKNWGVPDELSWPLVVLICVATNILLGWGVFLMMDPVMYVLEKFPWFARKAEPWLHRAQRRIHPYVEKYGMLGVAFFIGIPLPGSGVYTGGVGAYLLGMERKRFAIASVIGVLIAGTIVTTVCLFGRGTPAFNWIIKK